MNTKTDSQHHEFYMSHTDTDQAVSYLGLLAFLAGPDGITFTAEQMAKMPNQFGLKVILDGTSPFSPEYPATTTLIFEVKPDE